LAHIVTGEEYLALPRAPETWLIEGLLPVGGGLLIFGDPKVGKSYAALQLASCLVEGKDWLGFPVPRATTAVYVQLDTPRSLWADRVQSLKQSGYPVEKIHYADRETLETYPFDILDPEHFALLTQGLSFVKPGVVIIDTLRECHSGDENDSTDMQSVIAHLDAAVKPAALILISHARKSNPEFGYDLMNDNRGSNYVVGRMDAICRFSHKSMRCSSRTLEEHTTNLIRSDDGTWELAMDEFISAAEEMIASAEKGASVRDLARQLHERVPNRSEMACRAYLRRRLESGK
jgi:RecA-family ATPase